MLTRKPTSERQEFDWFYFSSGLMHSLCSDYIAVRLLYALEPITTCLTILPKMLDVAEKAMKLYLMVKTQTETALSDSRIDYGHNLEKLRAACAVFNEAFDHDEIKSFTQDLNDRDGKLYQHLRYGSQETTSGSQANTAEILTVIDRIFSNSLLLLPEDHRKLLLFSSALKALITRSRFDQSKDPTLLISALAYENEYFEDFKTLFEQMDKSHEELISHFDANAEHLAGTTGTMD